MASLSITQAWNETAEFVRREAGLLLPISFLLLAFPGALFQLLQPAPPAPGQAPELGWWLFLFPVALVAGLIGNVAIGYLALRPGASVGEALRRGGARLLALLAASLLIGIGLVFLFFVLAVIAVMVIPGAADAAQTGAATPAMIMAVWLVLALLAPIVLYFAARLLVMTPAAAVEAGGPLVLISRSWKLTDGFVWKLVGFLVLTFILLLILLGAIGAVTGILFRLVAGPLEPGSTSTILVTLVIALVRTVVAAYLATMVARIYAQLAGMRTPEVFA